MNHRLTALVALAAVVAVPSLASAATMRADPAYDRAPPSPTVVIPRDGDAPAILMSAENHYLANVCPTVLKHPGDNTSVLDRFCREFRG